MGKSTLRPNLGDVAERLIASVLKTEVGNTTGGSNPSISAYLTDSLVSDN